MQPFETDRTVRLQKFHDRLEQFLGPLAQRDDADIPVIAKTTCRFNCSVEVPIAPSEWRQWRTTDQDINSVMASTPIQYRRFITTGICPSCWQDMQPTIEGEAK